MKTYIRQIAIGLLVVVGCLGIFLWIKVSPAKIARVCPASYAELIATPEAQLTGTDIALMNLLCAEGLPGAENLDKKKCLAMLDEWAGVVKTAERKYARQYQQNPERYDNSFAKFKAVNLGLTLKQDLGCGYNMELVNSGAMADARSTRFLEIRATFFCTVLSQTARAVAPPCPY